MLHDGKLVCDMVDGCTDACTHIDRKGYVYCASHGIQRRESGTPCRKMLRSEIVKLERGETLGSY